MSSRLGIAGIVLLAAFGLAACGGGGGTAVVPPDQAIAERATIKMAISDASDAVEMVTEDASDATVDAADAAVAAARKAIADAAHVPEAEKAANTGTVDALASRLMAARESRMVAMDAAMMATAMKLYTGIGAAPLESTGDGTRTAAYSGTNDVDITVTIGTNPQALTATKMPVAANHGWEGKQYTASGTGVDGTYEAIVYSDVGDPTEGEKFNVQYSLIEGAVAVDTTDTGVAARVASSSFDQSAGLKRFRLPEATPSGATKITVSGSYHGVFGTYSCTPADFTCAVNVAESGFQLGIVAADGTFTDGGGTWMFTPTDPNAKVTSMPDTMYASYGWWLHKSADGMTFTASAFADDKGTIDPASGITALRGSATYMGGAAGKYALYSSTGGTNDAGHFTARATLEADFNTDMVTGTIDRFMGADGMSRNWSVELKKSGVGDTGTIIGADGVGDPMETVWTIDGTPAGAAGQWSGSLKDNGDDGVPKVATGTFHSEYSTSGRMVGAFGANKQ
ncbi:MAG: hypothetical protein OXC10_00335 [Rhodospirillaceae bacterium]|nr:hypothetical protein [Rhodospirillaceae bacterium]